MLPHFPNPESHFRHCRDSAFVHTGLSELAPKAQGFISYSPLVTANVCLAQNSPLHCRPHVFTEMSYRHLGKGVIAQAEPLICPHRAPPRLPLETLAPSPLRPYQSSVNLGLQWTPCLHPRWFSHGALCSPVLHKLGWSLSPIYGLLCLWQDNLYT